MTVDLADNAVTSGKIADGAVTSAKIADGAVTYDKLGADVQGMIGGVNGHLSDLDAGVAMALAMANVPMVQGKALSLGVAAGFYNGEQGGAVKINLVPPGTNIAISAGAGFASSGVGSATVGVAIGF